MREAMSYFLYIRPEEQIVRIGTTEQQVQRATEAMGRGDLTVAQVDFEIAARIEMYRGNTESVRAYLEKAQSLEKGDGSDRLSTLVSNLNKAMTIAKRYYHQDNIPQ